MVNGPAVTVVIPTHNRRQLLLRTLDSVLSQTGVELEVVVVDDGGTDGTPAAVDGLGAANVRLIRHERSRGVSGARNAGLADARTAWTAFVDDDDLWAPDKLRAQLDTLAERAPARWACVGTVGVDASLRVTSYSVGPPSGDVSGRLVRRNVIPGGGSGILVDTGLAREIGGYDESLSILADWDFYLRLSARSPLASVQRPLLAYYVHSDSMYHNPPGVVRELRILEDKHRELSGDVPFRFDRGYWFLTLARMSRRLGDPRAAAALLWCGVREGGPVGMAREVVPRLRRRFRRALSQKAHERSPALVRRMEAARSVEPWLRPYESRVVPGGAVGASTSSAALDAPS
jgi:glycosyltransferase involved in cell wall biosynthesis